ncbi:MAG: hypothetical protein V1487_00140 [bacterium]
MNDANLLIGALSNDLFRVATLVQRGSTEGATCFLIEAKRWTQTLQKMKMVEYIQQIVNDIDTVKLEPISLAMAEKLLMYGVLLQNYTLYNR